MVLVLGYRDHMLKTINPSVLRGLCDWTVELAKFKNKPLYFYDLMYGEWLWWSPLNREFVQLEGMHELNWDGVTSLASGLDLFIIHTIMSGLV